MASDTSATNDNLTAIEAVLPDLVTAIGNLTTVLSGLRDDLSQSAGFAERTAAIVSVLKKALDDASAALPAK